jgi:hypothetical protein
MDVRAGQRIVRFGPRLRARATVVVASVVVLVASAFSAVLATDTAGAASQARFIYNGGRISVISGDGCSLKPIRLTTTSTRKRRDYSKK